MSIIIIFLLCLISFVIGTKYKTLLLKLKGKSKKKTDEPETESKSNYDNFDFDAADLKMVFLVREDLKMGAGKIAAQVAHAAVCLFDDITNEGDEFHQTALEYWSEFGAKKIVLRGDNLETLTAAAKECKAKNIPYTMISDAGHTQVPAGSVTVLGIGVDTSEKINMVTGKFKLMR